MTMSRLHPKSIKSESLEGRAQALIPTFKASQMILMHSHWSASSRCLASHPFHLLLSACLLGILLS